jgi:ADP-ribose pyrophosphatase YjhB (NUDIX family)
MKLKVLAYIIRERDGESEILVFRHRDFPDAGVQVPAGTVEAGESLEAALHREIEEESGLNKLVIECEVTVRDFYSPVHREWHKRHFFRLLAPENLPETYQHTVSDSEGDRSLVFCYAWWPLEKAARELAGNQGAGLEY